MADTPRRRRGNRPPPEDAPRRRRRGGPAPQEPQRRRRRGRGGNGDQAVGDRQQQTEDPKGQDTAAADTAPAENAPVKNAPAENASPPTTSSSSTRSTAVATEVTLPQLGESVTEGTITAWLVEVGDTVEADQPLFELSSDKIDTEVPAPTGGVLKEIKVQVDETVDVGTVVAIIGDADESGGGGGGAAEEAKESEAQGGDTGGDAQAAGSVQEREEVAEDSGVQEPSQEPAAKREDTQATQETSPSSEGGGSSGALTSPLVRRLAKENNLDLSTISGTGDGGRITRADVEKAIEGGGQAEAPKEQPAAKQAAPQRREDSTPAATPQPERRPDTGGNRTRVEDLSRVRQRIAAKMMESLESAAQLTTVQEADITRIMLTRTRVKEDFKAREGVSLSPFVFLCRAAVLALRNHEKLNAQADWNAGRVTFHDYVNLGIAVDTEKGLLVPNVKGADDLSLAGLARAINDVANRARGKGKLEMRDIEGATFTMTNTGSVGVLIDTPILNYPEVAILGTGAVKKRPVVIEDANGPAIAIRDMVYFSLTYDHRLIDGADAARFVTEVKHIAETHDWDQEIGY